MLHSIIAIDGPAASGKSTTARILAKKLGFLFVSSGHFFRSVAWKAHEDKLDVSSPAKIDTWLTTLELRHEIIDGEVHLLINNKDLTEHLTDPVVTSHVSTLAAIPSVRDFLLNQQQDLGNHHNLVMEGRDIGSVIFPDTPFKFYLDASPEERLRRRAKEGNADAIAQRDYQDSTRTVAPLMIAPGATVIDTTLLNVEQVVEEIVTHLKENNLPLA